MLIGYARVSTDGQDPSGQVAALEAAGCARVFQEKQSGTRGDRPELLAALAFMRRDEDTLVVVRLDRLARSTADLLSIADRLRRDGNGLRSLSEPWLDTSSPAGRMIFTVFAGIAEFERSLIADRTREGRQRARALGKSMGRPFAVDAALWDLYAARYLDGKATLAELMAKTGLTRSTVYRRLALDRARSDSELGTRAD